MKRYPVTLVAFLLGTGLSAHASLLTRDDIKAIGKDSGIGHAPYLFFKYKVPNGALGNCAENHGQGLYETKLDSQGTVRMVHYVCTVPIFDNNEFTAALFGVAGGNDVSTYSFFPYWENLNAVSPNDVIHLLDEVGDLHRQRQAFYDSLAHDTQAPYVTAIWKYEGGATFSQGVFGTRIELYCNKYQGNPDLKTVCSEEKLHAVAQALSYDPTKGDFLQAVGGLVTGDNSNF